MINWNNDNIGFFIEASEYTGFHRELAQTIKPYLKPDWTMLDLGCGLGLLDIQLSRSVAKIMAIDINKTAIEDYNRRIKENKISNIKAIADDANEKRDEKWDVLLLSFYNGLDDDMQNYFSYARHKVVMTTFVNHGFNTDKVRFGLKRMCTTSSVETYLNSKGYKYKKIIKSMDFGQPFRTMNDAENFFKIYSADYGDTEANEMIKSNMSKVASTKDETYPYYLPKNKDIGILIIDK